MTTDLRSAVLNKLVIDRGLKTRGFGRELKRLLEEHGDPDDFEDFFGNLYNIRRYEDKSLLLPNARHLRPAAFEITKDEERDFPFGWNIHVYELAISAGVSDNKIQAYARIADGNGPRITLHIIDRAGNEVVIENSTLERFDWHFDRQKFWEAARLENTKGPGVQVVQIIETKIHTTKPEERAILRAVYELELFQQGDLK